VKCKSQLARTPVRAAIGRRLLRPRENLRLHFGVSTRYKPLARAPAENQQSLSLVTSEPGSELAEHYCAPWVSHYSTVVKGRQQMMPEPASRTPRPCPRSR